MQRTSSNKDKLRSIIGSNIGAIMEKIYSEVTISMSEFKKNPAAVLRDAKSRPVAVLNHNKAAFYMIEPALVEALLEELDDQELHRKVLSRMSERSKAIEVDIDDI
jgi:antitoxin StbD